MTAISTLLQGLRDRFFSLTFIFAVLRFPAYGWSLWELLPDRGEFTCPIPLEDFVSTFPPDRFQDLLCHPENIGLILVVLCLDRCTTPLIELLSNPVTRQAKIEIRAEEKKEQLLDKARRQEAGGEDAASQL